eukprot:2414356-Amphidinium_carterae.1
MVQQPAQSVAPTLIEDPLLTQDAWAAYLTKQGRKDAPKDGERLEWHSPAVQAASTSASSSGGV